MKRLRIIIASISVVVLGLGLTSISAQSDSIPDWIKNTAGWWASGQVGDSDFLNSMEWLINEGLITIPQNQNDEIEIKLFKKEFKFSMMQPNNWERQKVSLDPVKFIPIHSMIESSTFEEIEPTRISVVIEDLNGRTLDDYMESEWKTYTNILKTFGELQFSNDTEYVTIDGAEGLSYSYTFYTDPNLSLDMKADLTLKVKEVVLTHGGEAYTISYVAVEKNFNEHIDQFDEILETFTFSLI